jgi:hypothetical protein
VLAGDAALDDPAQTLAGVLVDDRHYLDRPPIGGAVELEVHRPHTVGRISFDRGRRGRGAAVLPGHAAGEPFTDPQQSCLMIGFRFRGRVNPPPGEWEAWQGDSEKRFRVEDIDGVTNTCRRTNFDLGGDQRADALERPNLVANSDRIP